MPAIKATSKFKTQDPKQNAGASLVARPEPNPANPSGKPRQSEERIRVIIPPASVGSMRLRRRRPGSEAMESKENSAHSAPPLNRPRGKRKALAELPTSTGPNTNQASAPPPSKPRTRSVARREAEAEEARKRREAEDAARGAGVGRPLDPRPPGAEAAIAPYAEDIDRYLRSLEVEQLRRPSPDYFQKVQKYISPRMRAVLVDWLVDVAEDFKLHAETLHLAVSYVDRFLTTNVVSRDKLQLLGVTAVFVAAKYEEMESSKTKVNRYTDITDDTYTKQQVVKMEADLLKSLNFEIGGPTVTTFLRQFIASCRGGNSISRGKLESMCSYLAELSLLDYDCISYLPSVVAAACLFVARFTIHPKTRPWNLTLQKNTGYKVFDLQKSIHVIHELQLTIRCPDEQAIREKYTNPKFGCVSTMASPREIPASFLEDCHK